MNAMATFVGNRLVWCVVMLAMLTVGCDDRDTSPQFTLTPEVERDWSYFDLAEAFGRHATRREFTQAYALMSQSFRDRVTPEAFAAELDKIVAEHGEAVDVKADSLDIGEVLHGRLSGFGDDVPDEKRAARVGVQLATRVAPEDPMLFEAWYHCWVYIVDEGDDELAVHRYEFTPARLVRPDEDVE